MTQPDAASIAAPVLAWENEGGAPPPEPAAMDACVDPAAAPAPAWRALAILGAMIAVWPDLSTPVRRRIAADAMVAMRPPTDEHGARA